MCPRLLARLGLFLLTAVPALAQCSQLAITRTATRRILSHPARHGLGHWACWPWWILLIVAWPASAQLQQSWSRGFSGAVTEMLIDTQTNLLVVGTGQGDYLAVKYRSDGTAIWAQRYNGGATEEIQALAADGAGQIWISGISTRITNGINFEQSSLTVKYRADGSLSWARHFDRGRFGETGRYGTGLAIDRSGNCYVAGRREMSANRWSLFLIKYSADGDLLWQRDHTIGTNWGLVFGNLSLARSTNLVIVGKGTELGTRQQRSFAMEFDLDGNLLWLRDPLPFVGGAWPTSMVVDRAGQVLLTGHPLAIGLTPDGELRWTQTRTGTRPGFAWADSVIDPAGNLNIAGTDVITIRSCRDCGESDTEYFLIPTKLSPDGRVLWAERSYAEFKDGSWRFDADASAYLAGRYRLPGVKSPHPNAILVKFAPNGAELWRTNLSTGELEEMQVDRSGNLYLAVGGFDSSVVQKYLQPLSLPVVRSNPVPRTILEGDDVVLTAAGSGFPSPTFQWQFNGEDLSGQTNSALLLSTVARQQAGIYRVVLSNELGSAVSGGASLVVNEQAPTLAPSFSLGQSSVIAGTPVTLCSGAVGGPKPTLEWRLNGVELLGETNACLVLGPTRLDQSGSYEVLARNHLGEARATIDLEVTPVTIAFFFGNPTNQVASAGDGVSLHAQIVLPKPYELQWRQDGTPLPTATNSLFSLYPLETNHTGRYTLVLTHSSGSYTSAPIDLTVVTVPPAFSRIDFLAGRTNALVGEDVMLWANFFGSPSEFQWRFNGVNVPGATNRSLALFSITPSQAGRYSFSVSNTAGTTTSPAVNITISNESPSFVVLPSNTSVIEEGTARFTGQARGGPPPEYFLEHDGAIVPVPYTHRRCCDSGGFSLLEVTLAQSGSYRFIASNYLGVARSAPVTLNVTPAGPLDRWTQRNPLPQSLGILAVVHAGQFVAVGQGGLILTSPDSATWTAQRRCTESALTGITFGDGLFVAVGEAGTILSSPDGTNWALRSTAFNTPLQAVTYGNGRFVAVGSAPQLSTVVYHSSDALHWERVSLRDFQATNCLRYFEGRFFASGRDALLTSPDGVNWSRATRFMNEIEDLVHADERFVGVGANGAIVISADGVTWDAFPAITPRRFLGLAHGQGRFVAVGDGGVIFTSLNGVAWAPAASGVPDRLESIVFAGGTFVAAGEAGTIVTSRDGTSWTRRTVGLTSDFNGVAVKDGNLVAVGARGAVMTSTDGVEFAEQSVGVTNDFYGVAWGDGGWLAVGASGVLLTSSNRMDWMARVSQTTNSLRDAVYAAGQWIVVGALGTILRSSNGIDWASTIIGSRFDFDAVAYGNGRYLIAAFEPIAEESSLFWSGDGTAWTQDRSISGELFQRIGFGDGNFIITSDFGYVFLTMDGSSIQRIFTPGAGARDVAWANGQWILTGKKGLLATSTNGMSWRRRLSRTSEDLNRVAWVNGRAVVFGSHGAIFQSDRFLTELLAPNPGDGGVTVPFQGVGNQVYEAQASSNLVDWTTLLSLTNRSERGEFRDPTPSISGRRLYRLKER